MTMNPRETHPALQTPLCRLAGVEYPIVMPGMGWVSDARLVAAVANAGALGMIGSASMTLSELIEAIAFTKAHTTLPYGVNLRSDSPDVFERAKVMIAEGVKVAGFALAPSERLIKMLKDGGVVCIPSVGAKRHAEKVAGWGADAVIVQGGEAGGHTGSISTTVLLPQIVDAVDIPVIAAGGFYDGRGLIAALSYGAVGVAMGTRFLLTQESPVPAAVKRVYIEKGVGDTVVTDQIDGHPHRVLRTPFVDRVVNARPWMALPTAISNALELRRKTGLRLTDMFRHAFAMRSQQHFSWNQIVMAANTPILLRKTMVDGEVEHGIISGGQVTGLIEDLPSCAQLVQQIITQAEFRLETFKR